MLLKYFNFLILLLLKYVF